MKKAQTSGIPRFAAKSRLSAELLVTDPGFVSSKG
jgi:hypothetical protein